MKINKALAASLTGGAAIVASGLVATPAFALGTLPANGAALSITGGNGPVGTTIPTFVTSKGCDQPGASQYEGLFFGPGLPDDGAPILGTNNLGFSATKSMTIKAGNSYLDTATVLGGASGLVDGHYVLEFACLDDFSGILGTFTQGLDIAGGQATVSAAPKTDSTTALAVTPASGQQAPVNVTLTATVAGSGGSPSGTVEFFNGSTSLGTVAVAAGSASLTVNGVGQGAYSYKAVYSGDTAFNTSTSPVVAYSVAKGAAAATQVSLTVPNNISAGSPTTISAAVTPAGAVGSVQLFDGTTQIGSTSVVGGTATFQPTFAAGDHSLQAKFTPADPTDYVASQSAVVPVSVAAAQFTPDVQTITGTIPAGTIVISTPYTASSPLDLGTLAIDPNGTKFSASAPFQNIQVVDTRAGDLPWTLSAQAGDLANGGSDVNDTISGQNVGLTDLAPTYLAGNALNASNPVTVSANAVPALPVAPGTTGTAGLGGQAHPIAHAAKGAGTVKLDGTLTLEAPTSTHPGKYTGVVTFTVAGS
ncbi:Ig-like domain-containing protein [Motilibacter rhizosphaerae]|uniref:Ig-like domain-containing protein n=1 Tax=Motilibacter rhizosphaerae TaxID=598652 RepID=A0A4Q7NWB8_9ACTN|nr:Ig-like domain-containing protein [Motilibacter rhizosphaerae]RZS91198.1 Ig-like domain-containing protein [Motilibacter rhizosphaerae]